MSRLLGLSALALWAGSTLLLSCTMRFGRLTYTERLRPHVSGGAAGTRRLGLLSVESFREVLAPVARAFGDRVARLVGITEDLGVRLERVHAQIDPATFRLRQLALASLGFGAAALVVLVTGMPSGLALILLLGAPLLVFLGVEQNLAHESERRRHRLLRELPVLSEQLGMLLSAGFPLGPALTRIAQRGHGVGAEDLETVVTRMRQGIDTQPALEEWAAIARLPAVDRLVAVLAMNREATDLGALISEEARSIRREVQRELIETIEKRGQQVWIPVTVAALIPGALFIAVPFLHTLRQFGAG